jgi:hypothetical protein
MAAGTMSPTGNAPATPSASKQTVSSAYIDFTDSGTAGWAQQYLPDLIAGEAEVFGNRTISGFLGQVGSEEAMTSDQVIWSEQGRLHVSAAGAIVAATGVVTSTGHSVRVGDNVVLNRTAVGTLRCHVTAITANTYTVLPYTQAAMNTAGAGALTFTDGAVTGFVFGSEFAKGTAGRAEYLEPQHASLSNKPFIAKEKYTVSGSDASAIGWVEVSGEDGANGYLWYLKAASEARVRFTDYAEMMCIESEKKQNSSTVAVTGSEGLFAAIEDRGHVLSGGFVDASAADDLASLKLILKRFDAEGAIEENMMFLNREASISIDTMLANQNAYGTGGTSYGVFNNSEDMALNLGFSGFRRGSYDFYKSDWKYLNDGALYGTMAEGDAVSGVIAPAGMSSVYDQSLGRNLKRPFLHVRYRASQTENRKMKTWTTGSVAGNTSSDLDALEMNMLTERCLVVQGANNFMKLV